MSQQLFKAYWQSLKFTLKDIPSANYYHRFHKRDINRIITIPCPNVEEAPLFKSLRANIGVKEDYVCPQCPHQKNCEISFKQPEGGDMQSLKLTSLNQFLTRLGESQLIINDEKNYWLSAIRMIDTFHSVVSDFQNGNQLNEEFLKEVANGVVDPNKMKSEKKVEEKSVKKGDFINSSNRSRNYSDKSTNFSNRDTQKETRTNRDGGEFRNDRDNRKARYNKDDDDGVILDGLKNYNNTNERKEYGSQNRYNNDSHQSYKRNNDYEGKRQQYGEQRQSKYGEQRYGENRSKSYGDKPQYGERRQQSYGDSNYKQKQYGEQRQQYGQSKYGEQRQQYGEQKQQYGEQRQQYGEQREQREQRKQYREPYGEQKQSDEQQQQTREQKNIKYNTERTQESVEVKERSTQVKSQENNQKQAESGRKVKRNMKFTIAQ